MISKSWVLARLKEFDHLPKKSLGQNFLIHEATIKRILSATHDFGGENLYEIGPGLGSLTESLRHLGLPITLIERDEHLGKYWQAQGFNCLIQDALDNDWSTIPERSVLVSNLPYQIAARLVIELCLQKAPFIGMVLMFQKEVGQKIRAQKGDSCLLSVLTQTFWSVKKLCDLGPEHFYPSPKIRSEVIRFDPLSPNIDSKKLLSLLKAAFVAPRRQLKNNLSSLYPKEHITEAMDFLPVNIRPEALAPKDYLVLFSRLNKESRH